MPTFVERFREKIPLGLRPLASRLRRVFRPTLAELVARDSFARKNFRAPVRNNFVEVFFPRAADPKLALEEIHGLAAPLNEVDGKILEYCEEVARRTPSVNDFELVERLVYWKHLRVERSFLEGVVERKWIFSRLSERLGEPFSERIARERPELLAALCRMEPSFARVFRLNVFVAPVRVRALLRRLGRENEANPALLRDMRRLEIATLSPSADHAPPFPVLLFYFDGEARAKRAHEPLVSWLVGNLPPEVSASSPPEFAERFHPAATMTEGYRLYKQYLAALGCLDRVYDPKTHHAYALRP